jgi:hypothetical protein
VTLLSSTSVSRRLRWTPVLLVAAGSCVIAPAAAGDDAPRGSVEPATARSTVTTAADTRMSGRGTATSAIGASAVAGALAGGGDPHAYAFIAQVDGRPVHWDRCRRIGYRVSLRRAPQRGLRQAKQAVGRVAEASGLRFDYQGTSTVRPRLSADYQRGTRLVIGWMTAAESPPLAGGVAGYGGPAYRTDRGHRGEIVKAFVQLDASLNNDLSNGFGAGPRRGVQGTKGQLLMHEISHAVGLDHVRDRRQILYRSLTRKKAVFGAGDRNGLQRVGERQPCF